MINQLTRELIPLTAIRNRKKRKKCKHFFSKFKNLTFLNFIIQLWYISNKRRKREVLLVNIKNAKKH
jgi:hypothetical protein